MAQKIVSIDLVINYEDEADLIDFVNHIDDIEFRDEDYNCELQCINNIKYRNVNEEA